MKKIKNETNSLINFKIKNKKTNKMEFLEVPPMYILAKMQKNKGTVTISDDVYKTLKDDVHFQRLEGSGRIKVTGT